MMLWSLHLLLRILTLSLGFCFPCAVHWIVPPWTVAENIPVKVFGLVPVLKSAASVAVLPLLSVAVPVQCPVKLYGVNCAAAATVPASSAMPSAATLVPEPESEVLMQPPLLPQNFGVAGPIAQRPRSTPARARRARPPACCGRRRATRTRAARRGSPAAGLRASAASTLSAPGGGAGAPPPR